MFKLILSVLLGLFLLNYDGAGVLGFLLRPIGLGIILWGGWTFFKGLKARKPAMPKGVPEHVQHLRYKHFHGKSGIAVDPERGEVHLKQDGHYKIYRFDEIRSWRTNIETGGMIYGGGVNALAANLANQRANKDNTGLFIKVKDVDYPEWKIDFPMGSAKKELTRWMEILQQTLNESAA